MKTKPKLRAEKTVLQVVSVSVSSDTHSETSDAKAFEVLQEAGFIGLKYKAKRTKAYSPEGDAIFLLEYDASNPANQKPFKMVRFEPHVCKEIETGRTIYIGDIAGANGFITIFLLGNSIGDWEIVCRNVNTEVVKAYKVIALRNGVLKSNEPIHNSMRREKVTTVPPPEKKKRDDEPTPNDASKVTQRLNRRLNSLSLALIELKAVTPEEWRQFIALRGTAQSSIDTSRLTEIIRGIEEVKQKISQAKIAVRSNTLG